MSKIVSGASRYAFKRFAILCSVVVILVAAAGLPSLQAQSDRALEVRHQRLLPLFELAGVVFTKADEASGRLVVGVLDRDVEGLVRERLPFLGVSSESVDVVETEPIFQLSTLQDYNRPVVASLQIRFSNYLCSLGFNAINSNGQSGFVTASHCSTTQGAVDGTSYYQPLLQDASQYIGTEIADPAYFKGGKGLICPRGKKCRYSDSNFSTGAPGVLYGLGSIARTIAPNNGSLDITGTFSITGEADAVKGNTVNKVGRTTGWTQGSVSGTCVNTAVSGSSIVLLCQTFVENKDVQIVKGGDSGSPVFSAPDASGKVQLLGVLWGGNASGTQFVYSPIGQVEQELGTLTTH